MVCATMSAQEQSFNLDNDLIRREFVYSNKHLTCKSYELSSGDMRFCRESSPEFSLNINDKPFSGLSEWESVKKRDTVDITGGKGFILTLFNKEYEFSVELAYLLYPNLPVVYKSLRVINHGSRDIKVEKVDVENLFLNWGATESWILRQYARQKWLGPYIGNWDDPLLIVHDLNRSCGIAVGNEAIGVTKRTAVFEDGRSMTAGLTHPEQDYGFRKWLRPGEQWDSPKVFTALYNNCTDGSKAINETVPDFVRRHAGMRIDQLSKKPTFVYNTWVPFYHNINEQLVIELAKAAAECGVEEFIIDDGWQINIDDPERKQGFHGDWEVDKQKFPNGLRPVFDYIKSLGMKPGLWVTLASVSPSSKVFKAHPEYLVQDSAGKATDLHNLNNSATACMGTDWYDYIKSVILRLVDEHGLSYVKLDLAIVTSAYVYDSSRTGCYAVTHPLHRDREESFEVIYRRCMQLFDELHREAPDLFIDCTFETAGKLQLMDYGIAKHAEGNWLSNVQQPSPVGPLRVRNLAWGRTPALPATSLVIGNLRMEEPSHELCYKSLTGTLPIMLGDPRNLTPAERQGYKSWSSWLKQLEARHSVMSFRQDLPGFGEPTEGCWDGFCRINTESGSGGLVGVFRWGAAETSRMVTVPWLVPDRKYIVRQGFESKFITEQTGKELAEKGFLVNLPEKYDGELFEITEK